MRKIQCETCTVRGEGAVCSVPADVLDEFRALGATAIYKPRQVIFTEGNPCGGLYLVCHGAVKLYHSDRFGREHILEIAGPRAVLGEFAVDPVQPLSVSAETLAETQLSFLPRERLLAFLQRHPMAAVRLLEALSRELALARRKVRDLALKRAESRLASLLIHLVDAAGDPKQKLQVRYSRRELAEMVGVSTETAIRLLAKLRDKQAITTTGRDIAISDLTRLMQIANYEDAES